MTYERKGLDYGYYSRFLEEMTGRKAFPPSTCGVFRAGKRCKKPPVRANSGRFIVATHWCSRQTCGPIPFPDLIFGRERGATQGRALRQVRKGELGHQPAET